MTMDWMNVPIYFHCTALDTHRGFCALLAFIHAFDDLDQYVRTEADSTFGWTTYTTQRTDLILSHPFDHILTLRVSKFFPFCRHRIDRSSDRCLRSLFMNELARSMMVIRARRMMMAGMLFLRDKHDKCNGHPPWSSNFRNLHSQCILPAIYVVPIIYCFPFIAINHRVTLYYTPLAVLQTRHDRQVEMDGGGQGGTSSLNGGFIDLGNWI